MISGLKMTRFLKVCFVLLFLLLLCAPFLQNRVHLLPEFALTENRLKIKRPDDLRLLLRPEGRYARKYEEYYNDNYGLRDLLIRCKNQLDFWVFHTSKEVLIGKDNWLFYRSVVEREQIAIEKASVKSFDRMFLRLEKMNKRLADQGIILVVLPCPMNNVIYPEMLPPEAARRPSPTGLDRYREFLGRHPEIVSIDPVPRLHELKGSFNVYHKTDFHWTDPAGAYIARDLVNLLGQKSGLGKLWDKPIRCRYEVQTYGGENNSLALWWPIKENMLFIDASDAETATRDVIFANMANEWEYKSRFRNNTNLIPETILFGDSFADAFLRAGFTKYFSHLQKHDVRKFKEKFSQIPSGTRFVIFEHVEVVLNAMLEDSFWPDELLN
jgi:hypothetical protein